MARFITRGIKERKFASAKGCPLGCLPSSTQTCERLWPYSDKLGWSLPEAFYKVPQLLLMILGVRTTPQKDARMHIFGSICPSHLSLSPHEPLMREIFDTVLVSYGAHLAASKAYIVPRNFRPRLQKTWVQADVEIFKPLCSMQEDHDFTNPSTLNTEPLQLAGEPGQPSLTLLYCKGPVYK